MTENKKTDVLPIEEQVAKTDVSPNTDEKTPVEEVTQTTSGDTPEIELQSDEEVLKKLEETSNKNKPTRKEQTIEKEARKLSSSMKDGMVDWEDLATKITNTDIGKAALEKFSEESGYDLDEIQFNLKQTHNDTRFRKYEEELEELKRFKESQEEKKQSESFIDFYKNEVAKYNLTPAEFDALYGKDFNSYLEQYSGKLDKTEAAKIAFGLTVEKDKEAERRIEEMKTKIRRKQGAGSPTPNVDMNVQNSKLLTLEQVQSLPREERIAYKKKNWNGSSVNYAR